MTTSSSTSRPTTGAGSGRAQQGSDTVESAAVRLSGAVMAHPKRAEEARRLAATDPRSRVRVALDPEPSGPPTALRSANVAWNTVAPDDATHHLVLQDDVRLAEGFFEYVERVAAAVPDEAVAFYTGWDGRNGGVVRLAALSGAEWAYAIEEHVPCLALMLPAEVARGYSRFAAEHGEGWPYDVVMQRYLHAREIPIRMAVPSTVDHSDVPSIAGNNTRGWRCAALFSPRSGEPSTYDCARYSVIPFYQYGDARCAIRNGTRWEYIETERHLRRVGLAAHCRAGYAASEPSALPERIARPVWETGFAIGAVLREITDRTPDPAVAHAVMGTLGPGGLCEEFTAAELRELIDPVRALALAALEAGGRARGLGGHASIRERTRLAVTGGAPDSDFTRQFAELLGDLGLHAERVPGPVGPDDLDGVGQLVHLGSSADGPDGLTRVLDAAQRAGVRRLIYLGSSAVYQGTEGGLATESSPAPAPRDATALAWWRAEELCREWGATNGIPVQVLRLAELIGPDAPDDGVAARLIRLTWTRRPLSLDKRRVNQVLDFRDLAEATRAVLDVPPRQPVFNVASATYPEEELARLIATAARPAAWEWVTDPEAERPAMETDLIRTELGWRPSAPLFGGLRAQSQWMSCDVHDIDRDGVRRTRLDG